MPYFDYRSNTLHKVIQAPCFSADSTNFKSIKFVWRAIVGQLSSSFPEDTMFENLSMSFVCCALSWTISVVFTSCGKLIALGPQEHSITEKLQTSGFAVITKSSTRK